MTNPKKVNSRAIKEVGRVISQLKTKPSTSRLPIYRPFNKEDLYLSRLPSYSSTFGNLTKPEEFPFYLGSINRNLFTPVSNNSTFNYKFDPRLSIDHLPGYMIKSLFSGSPLEKQISQNGNLSIGNLKLWTSKIDVPEIDKELIGRVLQKHQGEKSINYNTLKKEVQDLIPKYTRVPLSRYEDYGVERLGFKAGRSSDIFALLDRPEFLKLYEVRMSAEDGPVIYRKQNSIFDPLEEVLPDELDAFATNYRNTHPWEFKTEFPNLYEYIFESQGIAGNTKHYEGNPIGHSRTYVTEEEPYILHVMESQSDWAQNPVKLSDKQILKEKLVGLDRINRQKKAVEDYEKSLLTGILPDGRLGNTFELKLILEELLPNARLRLAEFLQRYNLATKGPEVIESYLLKTYLPRQIQENLLYAAENGQTKMRYPTSETAAKIEGYNREYPREVTRGGGLIDQLTNLTAKLRETYNTGSLNNEQETLLFKTISPEYLRLLSLIEEAPFDYPPQYQTILKKYADFPKQYLKLFKGSEVRTVTDPRGNTWYEVDVPENYLDMELLFKSGGSIHIKEKNRGKFTASAKAHGKGVQEYARSVVNNPNATTLLKRRALFAINSKNWSKH